MLTLDHLAVSGETLSAAAEMVETSLGVPMVAGGRHDVFHTHNRLLGLADGLYLEAIAADPDAPAPERPRWFDLDRFAGPPRLTNWICRTDDLEAALARLPEGVGRPVDLRRGDLRWRMAVPADGRLPYDNLFPALIEWQTDDHPAGRLPGSGVRLEQVIVRHPAGDELQRILAPVLREPRLRIETGSPKLSARFSTPNGPREL